MIAKRLVFLFPGFEPMQASEHAERFRRGALKSGETWGVQVDFPDGGLDGTGAAGHPPAVFAARLSGHGWRTDTELAICDWGDLILAYGRRGALRRFMRGLRALADFVLTGTLFRYCRVSWRYGLFFLFPILLLAAVIGAAALVSLFPFALGWSAVHLLWSVPLGISCAGLLIRLADRQLHLSTLMDDWAFAYDFCRRRNPEISARVAAHARTMAERFSPAAFDEILVVGHSLGASLAVLALADALAARTPSPPVHLLTVGSSLLKTALHPAAESQREAVRSLVAEHRLPWVDVQALSDPINFYRSNPALSLGIREGATPLVRRISLSRMVRPETYRRIKRNFFRLHRQFVLGAEQRRGYSFHMILLGPVPFERYAETGSIDRPPLSPEGSGDSCPRRHRVSAA